MGLSFGFGINEPTLLFSKQALWLGVLFLGIWDLGAQDFSQAQPFEPIQAFEGRTWFEFFGDSRDYLWIGSNEGCLRCEPRRCRLYETGLPLRHVFGFWEEADGSRVWLRCFRDGLAYWNPKTDVLEVPTWNEALREVLAQGWVRAMHRDIAGRLHLLLEHNLSDSARFSWYYVHDEVLVRGDLADLPRFFAQVRDSNYGAWLSWVLSNKDMYEPYYQDGLWVASQRLGVKWVWGLDSGRIETAWPKGQRLDRIFALDSQNIILRPYPQGALRWFSGRGFEERPFGFWPFELQTVFRAVGRLWLLSRDQRVYYLPPNLEAKPSNPILALAAWGRELWALSSEGLVLFPRALEAGFRASKARLEPDFYAGSWGIYNGLYRYEGGRFLPWLARLNKPIHDHIKWISSMPLEGDTLLGLAYPLGFLLVDASGHLVFDAEQAGFKHWATCAEPWADSVFIGTLNGLWLYWPKTAKVKALSLPLSTQPVIKQLYVQYPYLYVLTKREGFLRYNLNQGVWDLCLQQGPKAALPPYAWQALLPDETQTKVYLGAETGLFVWDWSKQHLAKLAGTAASIEQILTWGDTLAYLEAGRFISRAKSDLVWDSVQGPRFDLYCNGLVFDGTSSLVLEPNHRHIHLDLALLNWSSRTQFSWYYRWYRYGAEPADWILASGSDLNFRDLEAGNYVLEIWIWGQAGLKISVEVRPKFYETNLFKFLILVLVLALTFMFVYWARRQVARQKQLLSLQLLLLNGQMNPHFLFNTLSAIQGFLALGDTWQGIRYLSIFAKLIRGQLQYSTRLMISLQEEIEALRNYLALEAIRLGEAFCFNWDLPQDMEVLKGFEIPTMMLQPLVENAIIHGLSPKNGGRILLKFYLIENNRLKIEIEDNGLGRVEAGKRLERRGDLKPHNGLALANIARRIRLLKDLYGLEMFMDIEDLYDDLGLALGTRVALILGPSLKGLEPSPFA